MYCEETILTKKKNIFFSLLQFNLFAVLQLIFPKAFTMSYFLDF